MIEEQVRQDIGKVLDRLDTEKLTGVYIFLSTLYGSQERGQDQNECED